ncbi:hypothetical protein LTR70_002497 [Exophiala xenobiotica]|uniref:S-adenosyl-L-methionine-dependent methyltransferase n=1 Tax=Lithohypha guttulata TaxID=1690604 RepID=A0ABR0KKX2_9EURO|nr:hypothetical protein LTR24_001714 [Lithohypha guttulata]KAK5325332.1 hypothetical protein LTR70_002497 [Exophiala xenobiotica]
MATFDAAPNAAQTAGYQNRPIEADATSDYASDADSVRSDLTSVKSSTFEYQYENGRRYHAYRAGKYILPNDEQEQDRLDIMHHVFRLALDGEFCYSKLDQPLNILDVGTGTGIWAIEIGDLYPAAQVIGTDVSPIQPNWLPPNVSFQIDDATDSWAFPQNHFDFIHIRCLGGSVRDWPALLRQAYRHLKPGGKIELSEGRTHLCCDDGTFPMESDTNRWYTGFHQIARAHGLEFDPFPQMPDLLRQGGFINVLATERPCPIGTWPKDKKLKEIGRFFKHQFINMAVDSYSLALFTRIGGWSEAETQILLARVRDEFKGNKMHLYTHCSYAIAEKPQN